MSRQLIGWQFMQIIYDLTHLNHDQRTSTSGSTVHNPVWPDQVLPVQPHHRDVSSTPDDDWRDIEPPQVPATVQREHKPRWVLLDRTVRRPVSRALTALRLDWRQTTLYWNAAPAYHEFKVQSTSQERSRPTRYG